MKGLLRQGSIVVVLGPGGVGKTTVAAALGLAAARAGLDTGLITVDPARRLRDALGLERLSARPTRLDSRRLRAAGLETSARLSAMVLDVKRTWEGLVEEFVASPETRRQLRENFFYRGLAEQFAGAEAYAALEQLHSLHSARRFQIEVVDTPPAAHAFEFLAVPARLIRLLDSKGARWLLAQPSPGRGTSGLASRAAAFVVSQLETFTGNRMFSAASEFFSVAAEAAGSISERFRQTGELLRSAEARFVLVTTPAEDRLAEALALAEHAEREGFRLSGVVLNRMLDEPTFDALTTAPRRMPGHLRDIAKLRAALGGDSAKDPRLAALVAHFERYAANHRSELERALRFARELKSPIELIVAPEIEMSVRDLRSLARLGGILTAPVAGRKFLENAALACGVTQKSPRSGPPR